MSKQELTEQVISFVALAYGKDPSQLSAETNFKEDLGGQSISLVAVAASIEEELDVMLPLLEVAACGTIGDLADLVEAEM